MAAELFYLPFPTAFTSNGLPAAGAKLYFYYTGTTTPAPSFTSSALTVAHPHPVVANGAGRFPNVYLDNGSVLRLVIKDKAGITLQDTDPYIPGEINPGDISFDSVSGMATVGNRSLLAALPTSGGAAVLTESGREGVFVWSSANLSAQVTADSQQGIYVAPSAVFSSTGSQGAWVRQYSGDLWAHWFGCKSDFNGTTGTNNVTGYQGALAVSRALANTGDAGYPTGPVIRFRGGRYYFASTINRKEPTATYGNGSSLTDTNGTVFYFPPNTHGFIFNRHNTNGETGSVASTTGADGAITEGIRFVALDGAIDGNSACGIYARCRVEINNCRAERFARDGIAIVADEGGTNLGNANGSILRNPNGHFNGRHGVYIAGDNANAITVVNPFCEFNGAYGWKDITTLGNAWIGGQSASNGYLSSGHFSTTATVLYGGAVWSVWPNQIAAATTTAPSTSVPTIWYKEFETAGGPNADIPTWYSGIPLTEGGCGYLQAGSHVQPYGEGVQGPYYLASAVAWGESLACGKIGNGVGLYGGGSSNSLVNNKAYAIRQTNADGEVEAYFGDNTAGSGNILQYANDRTAQYYYLRLAFQDILTFDHGSTAIYQLTGASPGAFPTTTLGRTTPPPYVFKPRNLAVSSYDNPNDGRLVAMGGSAPTTGEHARGEIVFNANANAGEFIGWVCTVAGTPGTWKTFGAISA